MIKNLDCTDLSASVIAAIHDRDLACSLMLDFHEDATNRWLAKAARRSYRRESLASSRSLVTTIFEHCESPIERAFVLCVSAVSMAYFGPLGVTIRTPATIDEVVADHRSLRTWDALLREFCAMPDADQLMRAAFLDASIDARDAARHYFRDVVMGQQYAVRLVLQPAIPDLRIRPDVVIYDQKVDHLWIVECDGFDYHSDRRRFVSDRSRDRELTRRGFTPMRFGGSEIHRDPYGVALEFVQTLIAARGDA